MLDRLLAPLAELPPGRATLVVLGCSLAAAVLVEFVLVRALRTAVSWTDSSLDDVVVRALRLPLVVTAGFGGVFLLTRHPSVRSTLLAPEQWDAFLGNPALTVVVVVWAVGLNRAVGGVAERLQSGERRVDVAPVVSNVWTLAVALAAGTALLAVWRIDVTPLLGAAGVAGIAVGFAARDTVANFFGGLALFFDDTYRIGDYVVLDSGEAGTVVAVGVRSTTIRTRDDVLVTVPNALLNAGKVVNETAPGRRRRLKLPIGVAYGTDLAAFEAIGLDVAAAEEFVLDDPAPRMRFRRFGDFALEYELVCWVPSPHRVGRATHHLNRGLHDRLATAGIEVPYPKQEVSYRSADPADADAGRTDGDGRATPGGTGHRGRAGLPPGVRTVPDRMRGAPEGTRTRGPNQSSSEDPPDDS